MRGSILLTKNNFMGELRERILVENTRERIRPNQIPNVSRRSVNERRRKLPRSIIRKRAVASNDIRIVFISNNFALISRANVSEHTINAVIGVSEYNNSMIG